MQYLKNNNFFALDFITKDVNDGTITIDYLPFELIETLSLAYFKNNIIELIIGPSNFKIFSLDTNINPIRGCDIGYLSIANFFRVLVL